jgi:hypothetical protein
VKIIFSRKGFDSSVGRCPSPLVDGHPISLPIPTRQPSGTCYGDLRAPMPDLVRDLTKGRITVDSKCHLDPDLDFFALPARHCDWKGAFGQLAQAQQHLANQQVACGDLFLFWGLFRNVEKTDGLWSYTGRSIHAVFGWLQIGSIRSKADGRVLAGHPWLVNHPHARDGWSHDNTRSISPDRPLLSRLKLICRASASSARLWC